jgi:RNA polymerase subunit RPABC4/transcription elongation factor Spt4
MSYEGYIQYLCENGHLSLKDCYEDDIQICPICKAKIVWWNMVNTTNGSFSEEGERIDGYIELKIKTQKICDKCNSVLETTYKIPQNGGHKVGKE